MTLLWLTKLQPVATQIMGYFLDKELAIYRVVYEKSKGRKVLCTSAQLTHEFYITPCLQESIGRVFGLRVMPSRS